MDNLKATCMAKLIRFFSANSKDCHNFSNCVSSFGCRWIIRKNWASDWNYLLSVNRTIEESRVCNSNLIIVPLNPVINPKNMKCLKKCHPPPVANQAIESFSLPAFWCRAARCCEASKAEVSLWPAGSSRPVGATRDFLAFSKAPLSSRECDGLLCGFQGTWSGCLPILTMQQTAISATPKNNFLKILIIILWSRKSVRNELHPIC